MADKLTISRKRGLTPMHGVAFGGLGAVSFLLLAMGIPAIFLIFLGLISYFSWKAFSSIGESANRPIFEFYLKCDRVVSSKNSSLYGFEINETIAIGERLREMMPDPPPLVLFGLSELYRMRSEFAVAAERMNAAIAADEGSVLLDEPSDELREHVTSLRRIEMSPDEAPNLSASIRRLERKFRRALNDRDQNRDDGREPMLISERLNADDGQDDQTHPIGRRSISDVLHDIYDRP